MEVGKKLREARIAVDMTQEKVAEEIQVSRQTISNWENENSYPDIVSVIKLSDVYNISLDNLLKGDGELIQHLYESTNIVKSNQNLIIAFIINALLMVVLVICSSFLAGYTFFLVSFMLLIVISTTVIFCQIIRRF